MSLETILPFLELLAPYLTDPLVSDLMVNANRTVFLQKNGKRLQVAVEIPSNDLRHAVKRIARSVGEDISEINPILDARLSDGSRISAKFPPIVQGISLVIRKFRPNWFSLAQLVEISALPRPVADLLSEAVLNHENILIAGGTGTGKTTFTKALIDLIPAHERLEVIEDTRELKIDHLDVVQCEAQREQRDSTGKVIVPARTIRDLVKASLRDNPDRIIIGEVRGAEAFDLLDSANTGHTGSISTLHANAAMDALSRLETMASYADVNLSHTGIQARIGSFANLVVHIRKVEQRRFVSEVVRVSGFDLEKGCYQTNLVYNFLNAP